VTAKRTNLDPNRATGSAPAQAESAFRGRPATRLRAADHVFESLSRAILTGELTPGSVLATQRELSKQYGVSSLIVRQATHRLEEFGLVRVRQGSTTIVLDPEQASDVRLLQLQIELATPGDLLALATRENQALAALPMIALAERRATEDDLQFLDGLVEALPESPSSDEVRNFVSRYWRQIAKSTQNTVMQQQVRWWSRLVAELESRGGGTSLRPAHASRGAFRGLTRALRKRRGAVEYWSRTLQPLLDWTESQPKHVRNRARRVPVTLGSTAPPR
jgi:DNA-binding FadR family transcriptional regulator